MISFNWGFSGGVPLLLSPSPSPPAGRRSCTLLRCEINYGPSPLSITEESAFPRERRNNQKAFQPWGGGEPRTAEHIMRQGGCRASGRWFHMQMPGCLQVIIMVFDFSFSFFFPLLLSPPMLLLCRGFNSHMLSPSLSARFPWRSAPPLLPGAAEPPAPAIPLPFPRWKYRRPGRAAERLKRSPGPGARPPQERGAALP